MAAPLPERFTLNPDWPRLNEFADLFFKMLIEAYNSKTSEKHKWCCFFQAKRLNTFEFARILFVQAAQTQSLVELTVLTKLLKGLSLNTNLLTNTSPF